jgi:hypothetical protein
MDYTQLSTGYQSSATRNHQQEQITRTLLQLVDVLLGQTDGSGAGMEHFIQDTQHESHVPFAELAWDLDLHKKQTPKTKQ